jgi:hypothetical protein
LGQATSWFHGPNEEYKLRRPSDNEMRITDRCSTSVHPTNGSAMSNTSQYYHHSNDEENQLCTNERRLMCAILFYSPLRLDRSWGPSSLLLSGYRGSLLRREVGHSSPRLRKCGAIPPLPSTSSWHGT